MSKLMLHNIKVFVITSSLLVAGYCFFGRIGIGVVAVVFAIAQTV
jgi:hypothetical protein